MEKKNKRSVVLLGGGFSDGEYLELDEFLLQTVETKRPRVCFVPTASGDSLGYIERFYTGMSNYEADLCHLELFRRTVTDLDAYLREVDIVYVGGGNTANMLAVWRLHGLDSALWKAYERGVVLAGISAGAACWFEACLTDSFGALASLRDGLKILPGSFCPHYDTEENRAEIYGDAIMSGLLPSGIGLDDGVAVRYEDETLVEVCHSNSQRGVHYVSSPPVHGAN